MALMARHERARPKARLDRLDYNALKDMLGTCPVCVVTGRHTLGALAGGAHGEVYRRSHTSLTMRCQFCSLQWTMTWAKIAQAMRWQVDKRGDGLAKVILAIIEEQQP